MRCRKILTTLVVIAMVAATMIVFNFELTKNAMAVQGTPGYDYWMGTHDDVIQIINKTDGSKTDVTSRLYYGNTVDIQFNGSIISETNYLYYPNYNTVYDQTTGKYEVYVNWSLYSSTGITTSDLTIEDIYLSRAGMWLVLATNAPTLWKVNMSALQICDPPGSSNWEDITGWFWVNSSDDWTVSLSKTSFYYDKNESVTITVKDAAGNPINENCFIDVWYVKDIGSPFGQPGGVGAAQLAYHKELAASANGVWSVTGSRMYNIIHNYGSGTYQVSAYAAYEGSTSMHSSEAVYIYGASGDRTYDTYRGWNKTFGNTSSWAGRFINSGTNTQIRSWAGDIVSYTNWQDTGGASTTYRWDTCGAFDPPEHWTSYTNFSAIAGIPVVSYNNETQMFWNESYSSTQNQINVAIEDYDGDKMDVSSWTIKLFNKSNNPSRSTSNPIPSYLYSYEVDSSDNLVIYPAYNASNNNRWGWNSSYGTWAAKGKIYIVISYNSVGNASKEWNTTFTFNLISAANAFKWVHDGSTGTDKVIDGELGKIPSITYVPVNIKFKFISKDYEYFGDVPSNSGECTTVRECAENITISGNSLFTGTLDKYPNYANGWFSTDTWTVPIIPTMSAGGGEIQITAKAWDATIQGKLSIGGSNYLSNGSIVTVTPNKFAIDDVDQTLDIMVKAADGTTSMPGSTVTLYYIDEDAWAASAGPMDGANQHLDTITWWPTASTMEFNRTQQTVNQSTARSGLSEKHAPRNLTLYTSSNNIYGYALIRMDRNSNMKVAIGRETMMAGYPYNDFSYSVTLINSNNTPSTLTADKNNFKLDILDDEGDDVASSLFSDSGYTSGDFSTEYSRSASYFTDIYAIDAGTYTLYAHNKTHDSAGNNATLVIERVDVSCDKAPFIWKFDDNISATFSIRYNGAPINGSLLIDNMSDVGDYNMTWQNTSFDGSSDQGGNTSIDIDESNIINGDVTVHDITADNLEANKAIQNITFWFKPITDDDVEGAWARANGICGVSVPTVTPDPMYAALGVTTTVTFTVTGRGTPLDDIFVGLNGRGISVSDTNGTTGSDGTIEFSVTPSSTGKIDIHVGEEGRIVDTKLAITNWVLDVSVGVSQVNEGSDFTVTAIRAGTTTKVDGATVMITGIGSTTTDSNGMATFTAPSVTSDTTYTIKVTKAGFREDPDAITIKVLNIPKIYMSTPTSVSVGESFTIKAGADDGNNNGILIKITKGDGTVVKQGATVNGQVSFTIKENEAKPGKYTITATMTGYMDADSITVEIKTKAPGFELLTLIIAIGVALILLRRRRK